MRDLVVCSNITRKTRRGLRVLVFLLQYRPLLWRYLSAAMLAGPSVREMDDIRPVCSTGGPQREFLTRVSFFSVCCGLGPFSPQIGCRGRCSLFVSGCNGPEHLQTAPLSTLICLSCCCDRVCMSLPCGIFLGCGGPAFLCRTVAAFMSHGSCLECGLIMSGCSHTWVNSNPLGRAVCLCITSCIEKGDTIHFAA